MSLDLANLHALSDFNRRSKQFIEKLRRSGKPAILTVNGRAEVVVQSAASYQKLLEDQQLLKRLGESAAGLSKQIGEKDAPCARFSMNLPKRARSGLSEELPRSCQSRSRGGHYLCVSICVREVPRARRGRLTNLYSKLNDDGTLTKGLAWDSPVTSSDPPFSANPRLYLL